VLGTSPQPGCLARYAGHTDEVWSVALHIEEAGLIGLSGHKDGTVGVLHLSRERLSQIAHEHQDPIPQDDCLARYVQYTDGVGFTLHTDEEGFVGVLGSSNELLGMLGLRRKAIMEHAQEQTQLEQPDDRQPRRFIRATQYTWRSGSKVAPEAEGIPVFWGFSSRAVIKVTVTSAAENSPQLVFDTVCPFNELEFIPHDLVQLDEQTMVVGGASGNDIALLLLEWIRPD
jgi:hypothetical protein